ncbi:uncharacterized protein LOC114274849 [Camellia sinensis]|uniref:uncharacterized protein LOC114274849 n=1 Tax=Camellia sinensis TaxID=4442 RepID=UPI0010365BB2|nr:uncharacterized protein LOC114274849 [Camellia sinensis]
MVDTDYKKARKFEGGLTLEVFDRVGVLKLLKYVDVLDRALNAEANLAAMKQIKALTTKCKGKRFGFNSRKGACFRCGKIGHMMKDFPLTVDNVNHPTASSTGSTPTPRTNTRANTGEESLRQGRVFDLVPGDVQNTNSMVLGILLICAQKACVLIDSGSTHSFVSHVFSQKLTRPLETMNYLLSVSTPSGDSMVCAYVYPACDVIIREALLYVDLLPLDIDHFDCILGMDYLTKYHPTIDCVAKSVVFRPPGYLNLCL